MTVSEFSADRKDLIFKICPQNALKTRLTSLKVIITVHDVFNAILLNVVFGEKLNK